MFPNEKRINELLGVVKRKDLYAFLKLDRNSTPEVLRNAAQTVFEEVLNQGMRGLRPEARKDLASLCKVVFKDDATKDQYDRSLEESAEERRSDEWTGYSDESNESAMLKEGWELLGQERVDEAMAVAQSLPGNYSHYCAFRLAVAQAMFRHDREQEALNFIYWCEKEEPNNSDYKAMLAGFFADRGTAEWTRRDNVVYATRADHVREAMKYLRLARERAAAGGGANRDIQRAIQDLQENIRIATKRCWRGNGLAVVGAALYGFVWMNLPLPSEPGDPVTPAGIGWFLWLSGALYWMSSMEPQWKANARAHANRVVYPDPLLWYLAKAFCTVMFLPLVAVCKLVVNYGHSYGDSGSVPMKVGGAAAGFSRWSSAAGVGVLVLAALGLFVFGGSALPGLFRLGDRANGGGIQGVTEPGSRTPTSPAGAQAGEPPSREEGGGTFEPAGEAERGTAVQPEAPVPDVATAGTAEGAPSFDRSAWRRIQGGLKAAGFYPGSIDGLFGPGTRGAIRNWQTARGAEATGSLDEAQAEELMALAERSGPAPPRVAAGATDAAGGRLIVRAEPGSRIDLDGIESGSTGEDGVLVLSGIQAGRHVVVAHKQGYASASGAVEIVSSDTHELELRAERYAPVEARADDLRGNRASPDVTLEGEVSLAAARSRFDAGDYEAAADAAQALLQVRADNGPAHLLLGRTLYALGRFEDSIEPLRRAVALGERVELDARHRHGVGEFRQGFCRGVLTFGGGEVTFRSEEDGSHDFLAPADRITDVEVVESIDGQPFWLTSRVQDRGSQRRRVDFVHRNVLRQFRSGNSRFSAILVCSGCDGSLGVQAALMRAGG